MKKMFSGTKKVLYCLFTLKSTSRDLLKKKQALILLQVALYFCPKWYLFFLLLKCKTYMLLINSKKANKSNRGKIILSYIFGELWTSIGWKKIRTWKSSDTKFLKLEMKLAFLNSLMTAKPLEQCISGEVYYRDHLIKSLFTNILSKKFILITLIRNFKNFKKSKRKICQELFLKNMLMKKMIF